MADLKTIIRTLKEKEPLQNDRWVSIIKFLIVYYITINNFKV